MQHEEHEASEGLSEHVEGLAHIVVDAGLSVHFGPRSARVCLRTLYGL